MTEMKGKPTDTAHDSDPNEYDVVVLGTGVPEAILAAAFSQRGDRVLHLDERANYGGAWTAFTFEQLTKLQDFDYFHEFLHITEKADLLKGKSSKFAIELAPKTIFCNGDLVQLFTDTGSGRHLDFKLVEGVHVYAKPERETTPDGTEKTMPTHGDCAERVPTSKQDVFVSKTIGLVDKRRLVKFLTGIADPNVTPPPENSPFEDYLQTSGLPQNLREGIAYGVALLQQHYSKYEVKDALPNMIKFVSSLGRFGNSPFLATMYGGGTEMSQAFCRVAAVYGAVYMLNKEVQSLTWDDEQKRWNMVLAKGLEVSCARLVTNPKYAAQFGLASETARVKMQGIMAHQAVVITSTPIRQETDLSIFVVPPSALGGDAKGAVQVMHACPDLKVCPDGLYLLHFRGNAHDDVERAISLLIRQEDMVHTTFYQHESNPEVPESTTTVPESALWTVDWPSTGLDMDEVLQRITNEWKTRMGDAALIEALPDPEEERILNEARLLLEENEAARRELEHEGALNEESGQQQLDDEKSTSTGNDQSVD